MSTARINSLSNPCGGFDTRRLSCQQIESGRASGWASRRTEESFAMKGISIRRYQDSSVEMRWENEPEDRYL